MAWRIRILYKPIYEITYIRIRYLCYEDILLVSTWKASCSSIFSYVYPSRRKLLWVCSSSCPIDLLNCILIFDKLMAYWHFGLIPAWYQRFLPHFSESLQSNCLHNSRTTSTIQKKPYLSFMFWHFSSGLDADW